MSSFQNNERFVGVERLYGQFAMEKLRSAHVAIVGIGGVGSWTAESLARSGVGRFTLLDLDDICINNTNRQIHTLTETIGQMKVSAMARRIHQINPDCIVHIKEDFFTYATKDALFLDLTASPAPFHVLVDAIDSVNHKALLLAECLSRQIPVVSAGGAGGKRDPKYIQTAPLGKTHSDTLLKSVRKELRKTHGLTEEDYGSLQTVFSAEKILFSHQLRNQIENQPENSGSVRRASPGKLDCATGFGTVAHITASMGLFLAHLALEELVTDKKG